MSERPSSNRPRRLRRDKGPRDSQDVPTDSKKDKAPTGSSGQPPSQQHGRSRRNRRERERKPNTQSDFKEDAPKNFSRTKKEQSDKAGSSDKSDLSAQLLLGESLIQYGSRGLPRGNTKDMRQNHDRSLLFNDDSRLSTLVRRITREDDRDRRLTAAKQLRDYLYQPENGKIISKVIDNLLNALQDIFYERALNELKNEISVCMGILGSHLGYDAQRFFQWLFDKLSSTPSDEVKILLLVTLLQALAEDREKIQFNDLMPSVMNNLQTTLENVDTADLLVATVDNICHVAEVYPVAFGVHFRDTVDILVGWHIDTTQKKSLTTYTADALVSFHAFWIADMGFSMTLLGQFLEDMEAYAEDLNHDGRISPGDDEIPPPDVCESKISALLRVFTTVVEALGDHFNPMKSPAITPAYVAEVLQRVVKCKEVATQKAFKEEIVIAANEALQALCYGLQSHLSKCFDVVLKYALDQLESKFILTQSHLTSVLDLLHLIVENVGTALPADFVGKFLGPQSKFIKLRCQSDQTVLSSLMSVYHSLLGMKNIPLLESAYSFVLSDLELAYNRLLEHSDCKTKVELVKENAFKGKHVNLQDAEAAVIFDVCALSEIGSSKNTIIGMWALSPSIFELLTDYLSVCHWELAMYYPSIQYAVLQALYAHCNRHGHFISSNIGSSQPVTSEGSVFSSVTSSTTSSYFPKILTILADVLVHSATSCDIKLFAMKWLQQIMEKLQNTESPMLYNSVEFKSAFVALLSKATSSMSSLSLQACHCLQLVIAFKHLPSHLLKRLIEVSKVKLASTDSVVQEAYTTMFKSLPTDIITRFGDLSLMDGKQRTGTVSSRTETGSLHSLRMACHNHMAKPPTGSFHSHSFRSIMAFILKGAARGKYEGQDWLERQYFSCQRHEKIANNERLRKESNLFHDMVIGNDSLLWFWATSESAMFCVLAKLRTPLGKPQETFQNIESTLRAYAAESKSEEPKSPVSSTKDSSTLGSAYFATQLRPVLLLQFLDHLERHMYNAYEGCAVALPTLPKVVKMFFRTNRGTCQEWLNRIRLSAMSVALHSGQPAIVIRHGFELLQDMKNNNNSMGSDFEHAVMMVVKAMCELHSHEAIQGMMSWCKDVIGRNLPWIGNVSQQAAGRYEAATGEYMATIQKYLSLESIPNFANIPSISSKPSLKKLSSSTPPNSPKGKKAPVDITNVTNGGSKKTLLAKLPEPDAAVAEFLVNQVMECYVQLCEWSDVEKWQDSVQKMRTENTTSQMQKAFNIHTDINYIKALSSFEDHQFSEVAEHLELIPGATLDGLENDKQSELLCTLPWDPKELLQHNEIQMIRAVTYYQQSVKNSENTESARSTLQALLEKTCALSESCLNVASISVPSIHSPGHALLVQCVSALKNALSESEKDVIFPISDNLLLDPDHHDVGVFNKALRLTKYLQHVHGPENQSMYNQLCRIQMATARLARKQGNYQLAQKLLLDQLSLIDTNGDTFDSSTGLEINASEGAVTPLLTALSTLHHQGHDAHSVLQVERESAKLLNCMGSSVESIETLSTSIVKNSSLLDSGIHDSGLIGSKGDLTARSLLSLVKWIQADWKNINPHLKLPKGSDLIEMSKLTKNLGSLMDMEHDGVQQGLGVTVETNTGYESVGNSPGISETDGVCGRLLHLSAMQAPGLAKAWSSLANWCYKWGRKTVDIASSEGGVKLLPEEKSNVLSILPVGLTNDETDCILSVLSQAHCSASGIQDEDITEQVQSAYDDGTETTRKQLLNVCPALQTADAKVVDALLEIWKGVCRRIFSHYELAAKSYFTYLKLRGEEQCSHTTGTSDNSPRDRGDSRGTSRDENVNSNEDANTTATLRLLRLLVKHAGELRDVLEDGLANTPTGPWKGIIPQLFSRLNHPEAYVRQSISDLLCRVGQDSPHLIIYPAVIGCGPISTGKKGTSKEGMLNKILAVNATKQDDEDDIEVEDDVKDEDDDEDEDEDDEANRSMLQNAFGYILDNLAKFNPTLVSQVQVMVQELRRITLLWEELWLGTLNQHHIDVSGRRLPQLEDEIKRVLANSTLNKDEKMAIIREKHNAILRPTVYALEQVQAITKQPAETPNEKWFQENYSESINKAMESLQNPSNPANPHSSWSKFKQLHHSLQQRASKRATHILQMDEISPKLAQMNSTVISMPGLTAQSDQVVTIESFSNNVTILPTKTKPKKLVFVGSDGQKYTYLFKGLEDLHLDERIMQFLTIVNNMFARANKRHEVPLYHARHYSVTPLGPRSGLIQWVDGATPLFGLYKRWQQREASAAAIKAQGSSSTAVQPNPIPRPSEVYYSKMTPALKEKGVTDLSSRKEWPQSVMRQVLQELMDDTPRDLLSKELWCSCGGALEWWQITQSYARSTAVMSVIGYIIGLGDRHLDNVMVDLLTGEVVHIDYNVCFEKGRNLRVPERVPFRMTPNIESALGVTGTEGVFRLSCEQVLKTMRKGRETLLTLLEAFVYDPLVDWTTGNEAGFASAFYGGGQLNPAITEGRQTKEEMEREITRSLFSSRVAEMKGLWFKNKDELVASLGKLQDSLEAFSKVKADLAKLRNTEGNLGTQKSTLEAAMSDKKHSLHSLQKRYEEHSKVLSAQNGVQQSIQEKLSECDAWQTQHAKALDTVRGTHIATMCTEIAKPLDFGIPSYIPATEFLQNAGQTQTVIQCEQVETELSNMIHQRQQVLKGCLDVLHSYGTIVSQFPASFVHQNRCYDWQQWLQELVCNFTTEMCATIFSKFEEKYNAMKKSEKRKRVFSTEHKLQNILAEDNARLIKLLERRSQENADTGVLTAVVKDTSAAIRKFVKDNGASGVTSLTSVIVTALCTLNRRSLVMEGAAAGAGDRLMDLTSRDGSWFLEELCSMNGNISHLVGLLEEHPLIPMSDTVQNVIQTVSLSNKLYVALQDLNNSFRTIILPETMKTVQSEDPSVFQCIETLEDISNEFGLPLDAILQQLEVNLKQLTLGMEAGYVAITDVVQALRERFQHLIMPMSAKTEVSTSDMTAGQMLLAGFNGLFTQIDSVFSELLDVFNRLSVPTEWNKVDVVREARSLQCYIFTDSTRSILADIFFIKRLQTMQDFFSMCKQHAATFKGESSDKYSMSNGGIMVNGQPAPLYTLGEMDTSVNLVSDEHLSKPIKRFIADFVRGQLIGLPSQALGYTMCLYINGLGLDVVALVNTKDIGANCKVSIEEMCKKAVDTCMHKCDFSSGHLSQASALTSTHDTAWKKQDLARRLDINISGVQSSVQRAQLQLARYQWLHEDILLQSGHHSSPVITPTRSKIMSDLRKRVQMLTSLETALNTVHERYSTLEGSITQRLKWAAGANPSLNPVLQNIEEAMEKRSSFLTVNGKRTNDVISLCNAVLHFEAHRTRTQEAVNADTNFISLLKRCEESCNLAESCNSTVSTIEERFIALKPPSESMPIGEAWMKALLEAIQKEAKSNKYLIKQKESHLKHKKDALRTQFNISKGFVTTHHKLISEVKHMLRSMAREEDAITGDTETGRVRRFTSQYKTFSERFANMLKKVQEVFNGDDDSDHDINELMSVTGELSDTAQSLCEDLISLATPILAKKEEDEKAQQPSFASALKSSKEKESNEDSKEMKDSVISSSSNGNVRAVSPSRPPLLQQKAAHSTPSTPPSATKTSAPTQLRASLSVMRDPRTGKAIQMRNSYAVSVWRRVKAKLDGRDPDPAKRLSVAEQVDFVIRDATNFDNLAQLYEGWTAWV
ncbi:serine/threonine-protein kinase SMG1-like [Ptychodera flava]|uniref:serine/threonine-protein kinase SMG1-like n=1 Tax=Ptychodera flava TaxID=63121 RepID=UPI00396A5E1E